MYDVPSEANGEMEFDPSDEICPAAVYQWVSLADFYQWPHIQT